MDTKQDMYVDVDNKTGKIKTETMEVDILVESNELAYVEVKFELKKRRRYGSGSVEEADVTSSFMPALNDVDSLKTIEEVVKKLKKKMEDLEEREKVLVSKLKHSLSMMQRMLPDMILPS